MPDYEALYNELRETVQQTLDTLAAIEGAANGAGALLEKALQNGPTPAKEE